MAPGRRVSGEAALAAGARYNAPLSLGGSSSPFFLRPPLRDALSMLIQWLSNRASSRDCAGLETAAQLSVTEEEEEANLNWQL